MLKFKIDFRNWLEGESSVAVLNLSWGGYSIVIFFHLSKFCIRVVNCEFSLTYFERIIICLFKILRKLKKTLNLFNNKNYIKKCFKRNCGQSLLLTTEKKKLIYAHSLLLGLQFYIVSSPLPQVKLLGSFEIITCL